MHRVSAARHLFWVLKVFLGGCIVLWLCGENEVKTDACLPLETQQSISIQVLLQLRQWT